MVKRFEVFLVALDSILGSEIQKTRPCLIISPNEINFYLNTVIIAPMTTKIKPYVTRVPIYFGKKSGQIVLDQIRTVDKSRLVRKLGVIKEDEALLVIDILQKLFT